MNRLTDEEKLVCSLISKYPYSEIKDAIAETCEHQLEQDQEDCAACRAEIKAELEKEGICAFLDECDRDCSFNDVVSGCLWWQAYWQGKGVK